MKVKVYASRWQGRYTKGFPNVLRRMSGIFTIHLNYMKMRPIRKCCGMPPLSCKTDAAMTDLLILSAGLFHAARMYIWRRLKTPTHLPMFRCLRNIRALRSLDTLHQMYMKKKQAVIFMIRKACLQPKMRKSCFRR